MSKNISLAYLRTLALAHTAKFGQGGTNEILARNGVDLDSDDSIDEESLIGQFGSTLPHDAIMQCRLAGQKREGTSGSIGKFLASGDPRDAPKPLTRDEAEAIQTRLNRMAVARNDKSDDKPVPQTVAELHDGAYQKWNSAKHVKMAEAE